MSSGSDGSGRIYDVDAITLRRVNVGEKDRILTLFTRQRGKVSAVAKGARGPKSRLAGFTEPFTRFQGQLAHGQSLDILTQGQVQHAYLHIRGDLARVGYASHLLEVITAGVADRQPVPELWDLLAGALEALDGDSQPDLIVRAFELHTLRVLGFGPALHRCALDGLPLENDGIAFHPLRGGMLCAQCSAHAPGSVPLTPAAAALLQRLDRGPLAPLLREGAPEEARRQLAQCLVPYVRHHLDAPLRSLDFVDSLA